jgi:chemotaxis signal transduction protein
MSNQTETTETLRLIRCYTADETYGLDMSWVRSIQRTDRLRRNPEGQGPSSSRSDESFDGLRTGSVEPSGHSPVGWVTGSEGDIPVFSLASQLGRPSKEGGALQRVIVLNPPPQAGGNKGERSWALLVDRVSQVIQIPADRVAPLPPIVVNPSADYFKGVIRLDGELTLFLSPERLHDSTGSPQHTDAPQSPEPRPEPVEGPSADSPVEVEAGLAPAPRPPTASAGSQRHSRAQIVIFSIAEPHPGERVLSFGLSISQVPEIVEPIPVTPVPAAPAFVLGLVNWRDRPVPVVDLAGSLGLAPGENLSANGWSRLVVARDRGESNQGVLVAFLVRPAIRVLRLPVAHQPCSRTLSLDQALTRGIVELENETLVIPDIRSILWQDSVQPGLA